MNLISAVSACGDLRLSVIRSAVGSSGFSAFLKQLHHDAGGPILVLADNAAYHRSRETRDFLAQQEDEIELVYLPPYSPELNPDEQVWNHAKRQLGKHTIVSREMLEKAVYRILRSLQNQKDRVHSFFRLPRHAVHPGFPKMISKIF